MSLQFIRGTQLRQYKALRVKGRRFETTSSPMILQRRYPGNWVNHSGTQENKLVIRRMICKLLIIGRSSLIKWMRYPKEVNPMEREDSQTWNVVARL